MKNNINIDIKLNIEEIRKKVIEVNFESVILNNLQSTLNIDKDFILSYAKRNNLEVGQIYKIASKINRLPTNEDLKTIRLIGLNNFIQYSRPLI